MGASRCVKVVRPVPVTASTERASGTAITLSRSNVQVKIDTLKCHHTALILMRPAIGSPRVKLSQIIPLEKQALNNFKHLTKMSKKP